MTESAGELAHAPWLKDAIVFLVAAGIIVPLFHRARMGAVIGFVLVGVAVGPFGLGRLAPQHPWINWITIEKPAQAEPFAELGVIFLLFLLGLEMSFERLWTLRRYVFGVGAAQVAISALALGGASHLLGASAAAATVLGLCLALSSTAVVMQLLSEQHRTTSRVGRIALSVLLFQDLMVVPILFIAGALGGASSEVVFAGLAKAVLQALVAVVLISVLGRFLMRPLLRFAARTGSRDLIMAITLLIVVGASTATGGVGLSTALGAFLAGVLLGETEYRHHIEVDLDPFKGLLLGLFFVTVGMSIDPGMLIGHLIGVVGAVAGLVLIKAALLFAICRLFKMPGVVTGEVALLLAQGSEFAFVVFGIAGGNGVLSPELAQFATVVVALSMALTPLLAPLARAAGRRLERADQRSEQPETAAAELSGHVIIAGFGRVGQTVAGLLEQEGVHFIAIDGNAALVTDQRAAGRLVFFGDAGRLELLERAGIGRARAIVVTIDEFSVAERMINTVAKRWPRLTIFARAKDPTHAARLTQLGASGVTPEAVEASLQLAGRVLEALDVPDGAIAERLAAARQQEHQKLTTMSPRRAAAR